MYDVGTKLWKELPQLVIRRDYGFELTSYFLYCGKGKETKIPGNACDEDFTEYKISRYTLINEDEILVQFSFGVMLTLDLKYPSKGWKLYDEGMVTKPSSDQNLFVVKERSGNAWCAYDIQRGRNFGNDAAFPLSPFGEGDDGLKRRPFAAITPLEGQNAKGHVCIVQGGVSRKSKYPQVIMDVVDAQAAEVVASRRFEVEQKCKSFAPLSMFVLPHPEVIYVGGAWRVDMVYQSFSENFC